MSQEPDLDQAITEVQEALERLRIATARVSDNWEVVENPPPVSSSAAPAASATVIQDGYRSAPATDCASQAPNRSVPRSRAATAASFPACPQHCLDLCRPLSASGLGPEGRARRAWRAGCWAREVIEGRWPTPLSSETLNLRPSVYVVLWDPSLPNGARFSSFSALRAVIGDVSSSRAVFHSFPSLAEARVYCYGAQRPLPDLQ